MHLFLLAQFRQLGRELGDLLLCRLQILRNGRFLFEQRGHTPGLILQTAQLARLGLPFTFLLLQLGAQLMPFRFLLVKRRQLCFQLSQRCPCCSQRRFQRLLFISRRCGSLCLRFQGGQLLRQPRFFFGDSEFIRPFALLQLVKRIRPLLPTLKTRIGVLPRFVLCVDSFRII